MIGKAIHFSCGKVYFKMGIWCGKSTLVKNWVTIYQALPIRGISLYFPMLWEIDVEAHAFHIFWSIPQDVNLTGRKHLYFEKSINFPDFLHTMRFVSISRTVENWWENPCISDMTTLVNFFLWTLRFEWSVKKPCVAKVLLAIWEIFLHENNRDYNSYRFNYKFALIIFLFLLTNQRQKSGFQQIDGLVTKNIWFLFIASRALLQRHVEFNRFL